LGKWKKTLANKKDGGLGIGSLYGFNRALLLKWKWRFLNHPHAMWVRVIKSIHGDDGAFHIEKPRGDMESIWVIILKTIRELETKDIKLET